MTHGEIEETLKILTKHGIDIKVAKNIVDDINEYRKKRSLDCKYDILVGTMETKLGDSTITINEDWVTVETPIKNQDKVCVYHYALNSDSGAVTFTHYIKECYNEKSDETK